MSADERIIQLGRENGRARVSDADYPLCIPVIAEKKFSMNVEEARALVCLISNLFKKACENAKVKESQIQGFRTKFRDAGRRSAPWRVASSRVPGRPQDGADGNRTNRWTLEKDHKFYATEIIASLVEVKYYLQTLSMNNAPKVDFCDIESIFTPWLVEHEVKAGNYKDPIQLIDFDFNEFAKDRRLVQSGHVHR